MEKGFYHPERGYWQTIGEPSADILASYPEGTIEVPLKPGEFYEWDGEEWVYVAPPPPSKQELAAYTAAKRYEKEVGGTIWNGWPVHTDRESQGKIVAERLAIEAGEREDTDGWKFADGVFRMVSNEDFMALASAVRQHVRDCFALEAAVLAQIEAVTITEYSQIDAAFL